MNKPAIIQYVGNLSIRTKLLLGYVSAFVALFIAISLIVLPVMRTTIGDNLKNELSAVTQIIVSMVDTTADASIKNYLRAVAERNVDIAAMYHARAERGEISEDDAKRRAAAIFLSQHIGKEGYIFCLDDADILQVHPAPALQGKPGPDSNLNRRFQANKTGYIEYEHQNPGEPRLRRKVIYTQYFAPWKWVIAASAYRDEFAQLVNVDNFRDAVRSIHFGKSGYAFIIDSKGNTVIHPNKSGYYGDLKDVTGHPFVREICERKKGEVTYFWKDPDKSYSREKLVIFDYIPDFDWIVASSCYVDEIYSPYYEVRRTAIAAFGASLAIILTLTIAYSTYFARNFKRIIHGFKIGAAGDFSVRVMRASKDEFGRLADYFNDFMEKLESYNRSLKQEITDRRNVEEALRKRNDELERFEKVVVGRELRMVDLKKQIAELEERITRIGG